jgi:hypothetical protein
LVSFVFDFLWCWEVWKNFIYCWEVWKLEIFPVFVENCFNFWYVV